MSSAASRGTAECRASASISGICPHRQKSSLNDPGSPGELATSASGPGAASTMSIARAALASSRRLSTPRTQATPSRANAAASIRWPSTVPG
jgi:hypothetical protein